MKWDKISEGYLKSRNQVSIRLIESWKMVMVHYVVIGMD